MILQNFTNQTTNTTIIEWLMISKSTFELYGLHYFVRILIKYRFKGNEEENDQGMWKGKF